MDQPRWLEFAWGDLGVAETPGPANNPRVVRYYAEVGQPAVKDDAVAWCAAFAGACLERAGIRSSRSLMARSYLAWGEALSEPRTGAIAVLSRGFDPRLGHVGFLIDLTSAEVILLGGNQGDAVSVLAFPRARLLGLRWPSTVIPEVAPATIRDIPQVAPPARAPGQAATIRDPAPTAPLPGENEAFERGLTHVLEMEGGYDDDPYDPGGPTNFGITLAEFARDKGLALTGDNFAALKAELRSIPRATVRRIYYRNYWQAASCPELPPPLALFHFDAAVNQGVAGAARMLQQTVGAEVDGEIGPLTLAAVAGYPADEILAAYAEVRRQRYRSLSTFWRFGNGWLRRVDTTLALARSIGRTTPSAFPSQPKEPRPMPTDNLPATPPPAAGPETKWWGQSMTIWGVVVTALSTVLPVLGPAFGLNITPQLVHQLGDNVIVVAQAVGGLVGTIMAIYGRVRATAPIERRQFTLTM